MAPSIDAKAVAVVAATSAAAAYLIAKRQFESKAKTERRKRYENDRRVRFELDEERKKDGLPSGTKLDDVTTHGIYLWEVESLGKYFPSEGEGIENVMVALSEAGGGGKYNKLIGHHECILANIRRSPGKTDETTRAYVRAGPRAKLHFNPATVNAAIVTCGGLCPGLNNVVREITRALFHLYGIKGKVYGVVGGYAGFYDPKV